jgi:predicted RNA-binding protein
VVPGAIAKRIQAWTWAVLLPNGRFALILEPDMRNWLVVLSEDNWRICAQERLLSVGRDAERRLSRMADGDRVWIYVNRMYVDHQVPRIRELRAVVRVVGHVRQLETSPWKPRGRQQFNVARPIVIEQHCQIPILDLLKTMSFSAQPPAWGIRLRGAPLRLTDEDVAKLKDALDAAPTSL